MYLTNIPTGQQWQSGSTLTLTSEVVGSNPRSYVGNLELLTDGPQFTIQNLDQLYVVITSVHKLPIMI